MPFLCRSQGRVLKPFGRALPVQIPRITLCDTSPEIVDAWIDTFRDLDAVEIRQGDLLEVRCDSIVAPANSFGDMSGGLDKHIDDHFKGAAQRAVVEAIRSEFLGELPVGAALVVSLPPPTRVTIIAAPTMRVPGNVSNGLNAYLAMRATLVAVVRHNRRNVERLNHLGVPGLCTGVGGMRPAVSAVQMRAAYDSVIGGEWEAVVHPAMAPFGMGAAGGRRWTFDSGS